MPPRERTLPELLVRAGISSHEDFKAIGVRVPRRRRRPPPPSAAVVAFHEVQFHWTHLRAAFEAWRALPPETPRMGECAPARVLTMFLTAKIVTMDEAIVAFQKVVGREDETGRAFVKAARPLMKAARAYLPALKEMRSRWVAHGASSSGGNRGSAVAARSGGAPRDENELAYVVGLYLQYFMIAAFVFPRLLLEGQAMADSDVALLPPKSSGPPAEEHERNLRVLSHQVCSTLGLDELPVAAYDPGIFDV